MIDTTIDREKLEAILAKNNTLKSQLSTQMGRGKGFITDRLNKACCRFSKQEIALMATLLNCTAADLLPGEQVKPPIDVLEPSDFEKDVIKALSNIMNALQEQSKQIEQMMSTVGDAKKENDIENDKRKAKDLLLKMFEEKGTNAIEYADYKAKLAAMDIKDAYFIGEATKALNCGIKTIGYGNNKRKWIYKL